MALEYVLYGAADLTTDELRAMLHSVVGGTIAADGTIEREDLSIAGWRETPDEEADTVQLFGFRNRVTVFFRFDKRPALQEHATAVMIRAVLSLMERTGADSVLLFNGEDAVLRTVHGEAIFDADREEWEYPEAAALHDGHQVARLPQPLLPGRGDA
jgi:hypothetical protein